MGTSKRLLFSFIILKNALLKKKLSITVSSSSIDIELLKIFKYVGLIVNFYKIQGGLIKIIFSYTYGKPKWKIKTFLSKDRISRSAVRGPMYKANSLKGGVYLVNTPKGLLLDNVSPSCRKQGKIICVFLR